MIYYNDFRKL